MEVQMKIILIGNPNTGKTKLSSRYMSGCYSDPSKATVGVEFLTKVVTVMDQRIKISLWDTAGAEQYKSMSKIYYKGAAGVLVLYDITDPQSYLDLTAWMKIVDQNLNVNEIVMMVVGNKCDLEEERKITPERPVRDFQDQFDIDCWEVSAKTGHNVDQLFETLVEKIYRANYMSNYIEEDGPESHVKTVEEEPSAQQSRAEQPRPPRHQHTQSVALSAAKSGPKGKRKEDKSCC